MRLPCTWSPYKDRAPASAVRFGEGVGVLGGEAKGVSLAFVAGAVAGQRAGSEEFGNLRVAKRCKPFLVAPGYDGRTLLFGFQCGLLVCASWAL